MGFVAQTGDGWPQVLAYARLRGDPWLITSVTSDMTEEGFDLLTKPEPVVLDENDTALVKASAKHLLEHL